MAARTSIPGTSHTLERNISERQCEPSTEDEKRRRIISPSAQAAPTRLPGSPGYDYTGLGGWNLFSSWREPLGTGGWRFTSSARPEAGTPWRMRLRHPGESPWQRPPLLG